MSDDKRSIRIPKWLAPMIDRWCRLHDTTFSRLSIRAIHRFLMEENMDKHSGHVRCDLVDVGGEIRVIPNSEGKFLVSKYATQELLREMYERGQQWR